MRLTCDLSDQSSDALRAFARRQGSTVFKVILGLAWCCFRRLYGKSDVIFGVPVANRKTADSKRTVGMFAKTIPFRPRLDQT